MLFFKNKNIELFGFDGNVKINQIVNFINKNSFNNAISKKIILVIPFIYLHQISKLIDHNKKIEIAAQNCHTENYGPYTGEISAPMIKSTGANYVIVENFFNLNFNNKNINNILKKINASISNGLKPIFCCWGNVDMKEKIETFIFKHSKEHVNEILYVYKEHTIFFKKSN